MVVVTSLVGLLEPWPMALLIDSALGDKPLPGPLETLIGDGAGPRILLAVAMGLLVALGINGFAAISQYISTKLEMRMVLDFRSRLFQHVQRLSFGYHDDRLTGEFMGRINQQAQSVGKVTVAIFPLLGSLLTLIGMFWIAYRLNPPVALVALSVVPFIYLSTGYYGTRIGPRVRKVKGMEIRSLHMVHEAMQMLRVVVAFNREGHEYDKFRAQGEQAVDARVEVTSRQTMFSVMVSLITATGTAAVLGVGAWQVINGGLTVGELLVLIAYISAVYKPLDTISTTINSIQENLIGYEMAEELLATQPEVVESESAVTMDRAEGAVEFDGVSFDYPGRENTLRNLSFTVKPGETVAIVGPTGAGKSTLASLLPRFYDPSAGRILLDGTDLRDLTLESLRAQMSLVLQEPLLFTGSIKENIRYGRLEASDEEVREAARAANAHDFIKRLPKRYGTKLGERGAKLSGGERQRICIARAFLKDAPILILDEPTSSIDSRTEATILEALERLAEGRTTFMIAHRLSTVRSASQILVVSDGEIVERGTHDELLRLRSLYCLLHEMQDGGRDGERRRSRARPLRARPLRVRAADRRRR
ncbi:MAG: ABC transporter ATP-binding protein/permease [Actinobacteria bacterium]|nr:ABC transporter ATP-binding protein/permease [Actinomycetota bacterium]MBW3613982.1 ABC transporter ATP-binding protein/permease [Actinomycetota bacterium]